MKDIKTQNDIEKLLDNVAQILDIFKKFEQKVIKIENLIEGKPTDGIPSLYKDIENLKEQSKIIESKILDILKSLQNLKEDFSKTNVDFDKTSEGLEKLQKDFEALSNFIEKELDNLSKKITELEIFKEQKKGINAFITWIIPILSIGLLIFLNVIMPLMKVQK